jgi:hypothetical protein
MMIFIIINTPAATSENTKNDKRTHLVQPFFMSVITFEYMAMNPIA